MPKYKEVKIPDIRPHLRQEKFLACLKHGMVFIEGFQCPDCKSGARSIFDDWQPSQDQGDVRDEYGQAVSLSMAAAAAEEKIPQPGVYKMARCPLHGHVYVQGLNECPECKCWAC
jgi:hypothetical protein